MQTRSEPQFGLGKSLAFSLILIFSFLLFAELAVRGWAYFLRADVEKYDPATETFVLVPGRYESRGASVEINSAGFVGREIEPAGPDLWRIAAVGDSCTFGAGNAKHTYPAMLDDLLQRREKPELRYEVVNAGISGLNSELALRRLRTAVLPLEPDVITIYIGWNDLMKFDPLAQGEVARWSGFARFFDRLWLVKGLRKVIFFHVRPLLRPPATGPESRSGRFAWFHPTFYEKNLRAMVSAARESGAHVLLATLPTVVREDMTAADLKRAGVVFPYFRSAYGVGDLLDLILAYNRTVRRVAAEEQIALADLAVLFEKLADPRPYFYDTMHTNAQGMALIAEELERVLAAHALLAPEPRAVSSED